MPYDPDVSTWKVLVVDDEPDNRTLAERFLTFYGATVYTACDGDEGIRMLQQTDPNLVLLDIAMPNVDGLTMLDKIRAMPETAKLPVIAFTAFVSSDAKRAILRAGFDGFVSKPFHFYVMLNEIKNALRRHQNVL